jgi:predicted small integral membrane protein
LCLSETDICSEWQEEAMINVFRISKVILVSAVAVTVSLVAFDNLTDYDTNWTFVTHVLSMDTVPLRSALHYRAITNPIVQQISYWLIIAAEVLTAALCWTGAFALYLARNASLGSFNAAKKYAVAGLTLGFVTWQFAFMSVGGEWFSMWQSASWNGLVSAYRFQMTILAVLICVSLPEPA